MTIAEALAEFVKRGKSPRVVIATVSDIDSSARTITAKLAASDGELPDVRLTSVIDSNGNYSCDYPKKDSSVWLAIADGSKEAVVIAMSEIEKRELIIGSMKYMVDKDGFVFNDGNKGGLPIVSKVKDNLDTIKNYVTAMKAAITSALGTVDAAAGSASSGTFTTTMAALNMNQVDMENKDIKQ